MAGIVADIEGFVAVWGLCQARRIERVGIIVSIGFSRVGLELFKRGYALAEDHQGEQGH